MKKTIIQLHSQYTIGTVDPRIFGGFLEHMGRAVYEGVYDPKSAHADKDGFRTDVLNALQNMKYTAMRYPGGILHLDIIGSMESVRVRSDR